jgi:hypothetical protein
VSRPGTEIDEQKADPRLGADVAKRQEHAVPVVNREGQGVFVDNTHETGRTALVRALRIAVAVARREEKHVTRLDELPRVGVDGVGNEELIDTVGDPTRIEAILPIPMFLGVRHAAIIANSRDGWL